jgi:hypothetical protein
MNTELLNQIVRHIFSSLAVIPSSFIDVNKTKSLMTNEFLLKDTLSFEIEGKSITNKIWGCQLSAEDNELKIILGDCTQDRDIPEYCLIVQLKNFPTYGVYLVYNDLVGEDIPSEPLIACTLNGSDWLLCNTFLQATFLAGMEQMKELGLSLNKCSNYETHINSMKTFITYHDSYYGVEE